jgi:pentatricopeptide repeat protein
MQLSQAQDRAGAARYYELGDGVEKDLKKAEQLYREAESMGHAPSCQWLEEREGRIG